MKISNLLLILLALLAIAQVIYYYPQLPDTMASHFSGEETPNAWLSKNLFFAIDLAAVVLVLIIFVAVPMVIRLAPTASFNLPNKEHWLSPEHRSDTFEFITSQFNWFGIVHLVLIIAVIQFAIAANLQQNPVISSIAIWILLGAYALYVAIWLFRFFAKFKHPKG